MKEHTILQRGLFIGAWLAWMGMIFYFSTQSWGGTETRSELEELLAVYLPSVRELLSTADIEHINFAIRKIAHFTEYAILTGLGYLGCGIGLGQAPAQALRLTLLCSILFAISDEFHQLFEAGRTSLATDVLIDSLGASVVALIIQRVVLRSQPS